MSYAQQNQGDVRVGSAARQDVVLAHASLSASKIILDATKKPASIRARFVANKLDSIQPGLARKVAATHRSLVARGKGRDQAAFDAMRLGIANANMDRGLLALNARVDAIRNGSAEALGDWAPNDRATACTVASTASTVGGVASIIPVYGTIVGLVTSVGSGIASQALDCGRESRDAAAAAAQAQANLQAAQAQAQQQQLAQQQAGHQQLVQTALIGGGIVGALALAYFII